MPRILEPIPRACMLGPGAAAREPGKTNGCWALATFVTFRGGCGDSDGHLSSESNQRARCAAFRRRGRGTVQPRCFPPGRGALLPFETCHTLLGIGTRAQLRGAAQTPRARAAIHGWGAPKTEQGVSYDWARSFVALLDTQPVPENSLRSGQIKRSSCRKRSDVEAAGTATSRRQHLQVRRKVRPEEVRCLRPTPAVHFRPLPAAVCAVYPLSALLTHCIAVVWQ